MKKTDNPTSPVSQYPMNYLDLFLSKSSERIILKKKLKKSKINVSVSDDTREKFINFVKKNHDGIIKGAYSLEVERALMLYLTLYDV